MTIRPITPSERRIVGMIADDEIVRGNNGGAALIRRICEEHERMSRLPDPSRLTHTGARQ